MSEKLRRKLKQTNLRLSLSRAFSIGVWSLTASFGISAAVIAADRLLSLGLGWPRLLTAAVALAAGATIVLGWLFRRSPIDAALALDARAGLEERLTTLLTLPKSQHDEPIARALAEDLESRMDQVDVTRSVPLRRPRWIWAPLVPLAAALACAYLLPPIAGAAATETKRLAKEERARVEREAKELVRRIDEKKEELSKSGVSEEIKSLTAEIERATKEMAENKKVGTEEAALKLSDMARKLEERKAAGDSIDQMKRALERLPRPDEGAAAELQKALRQGEFQKAADEMKKLRDEIAKGDLSPSQKEQLGRQLAKLEEDLRKASDLAERAKQLQQGLSDKDVQKQLDKLAEQAKDLKSLKDLAEKVADCAKCAGGGDGQPKAGEDPIAGGKKTDGKPEAQGGDGDESEKLAESLKDAENILRDLAQRDVDREALGQLLDDLNESRGGMVRRQGDPQSQPGKGWDLSKGNRDGARPEQNENAKSRRSRSQGKTGDGRSLIVGRVDGPNVGGKSDIEVRASIPAAAKEADEAITRQPIPDEYKDHTRDYFDRLNEEKKK